MLPISVGDHIRIPVSELEFSYARSSGPGGQNVNKVNSKAVLRWSFSASEALPLGVRVRFAARFATRLTQAGDLVLTSDRYRDQGRNAADCVEKLRAMLLEVARPPKDRRATKPTRGSKKRRVEGKRVRAGHKQNRGRVSGSD